MEYNDACILWFGMHSLFELAIVIWLEIVCDRNFSPLHIYLLPSRTAINIYQYCKKVLKRTHLIPLDYYGWTFQFWKNMVTFPPHTVTFPWYFYKTTSQIKTTKIAWVLLFLPRWSKSKVAPSIIDASICLYDFQNRILYDMQNTFSFFSRLLQLLNMLSLPVYK